MLSAAEVSVGPLAQLSSHLLVFPPTRLTFFHKHILRRPSTSSAFLQSLSASPCVCGLPFSAYTIFCGFGLLKPSDTGAISYGRSLSASPHVVTLVYYISSLTTMADTATSTPAAMSMPLINTGMGPVGYENGAQAHMPPPSVPPISIPHNTSNVMAALSALPPSSAILSPLSATALGAQQAAQQAASARRVAPEPNKRALYVGGLDPRVTEDVLKQIFETTGHVQSVKIIPDKNVSPHFSDMK